MKLHPNLKRPAPVTIADAQSDFKRAVQRQKHAVETALARITSARKEITVIESLISRSGNLRAFAALLTSVKTLDAKMSAMHADLTPIAR
jgi:hypothetical protein